MIKNIYDRIKANAFMKNIQNAEESEYLFFSRIVRSVEINYIVSEHYDIQEKMYQKIQNNVEKDYEHYDTFLKIGSF